MTINAVSVIMGDSKLGWQRTGTVKLLPGNTGDLYSLPTGLWGCLPMPPACCWSVAAATPRGCGSNCMDQMGLWEVTAALEIPRAIQKEQQNIRRTVILERKDVRISKAGTLWEYYTSEVSNILQLRCFHVQSFGFKSLPCICLLQICLQFFWKLSSLFQRCY